MPEYWDSMTILLFIVNVITPTISTLTLILAIYHICYGNRKSIRRRVKNRCSIRLTLICLAVLWMTSCFDPINMYVYWVNYDPEIATVVYYLIYCLYTVGRLLLYFVYIHRVHIAFKDTVYKPSKFMFVLVIIGTIIQPTVMTFTFFYGSSWDYGGSSNTGFIILMIAYSIFLLIDVLEIIGITLLFVMPIFKLIKARKEIVLNATERGLLYLSAKLTLLSFVSILTSFIYQLLWVISVGIYHSNMHLFKFTNVTWGFDTTINAVCVFLSFSFANKYYNKLCNGRVPFHQCVIRSFMYCLGVTLHVKIPDNLKMHQVQQSHVSEQTVESNTETILTTKNSKINMSVLKSKMLPTIEDQIDQLENSNNKTVTLDDIGFYSEPTTLGQRFNLGSQVYAKSNLR